MRDEPDHYAVLGVSPRAPREAIRRAWLDLARTTHPDSVGGDPVAKARAEASIRRINAAWTVLGDDDSRAAYDARRTARLTAGAAGVSADRSAPPSTRASGSHAVRRPPVTPVSGEHLRWGWVPAILVGGVLLLIVALSIYATTSDDPSGGSATPSTTTTVPSVGSCVWIIPTDRGPTAETTDCAGPSSGRVVATVETPRPCPTGVATQLADHRTTLCLVAR